MTTKASLCLALRVAALAGFIFLRGVVFAEEAPQADGGVAKPVKASELVAQQGMGLGGGDLLGQIFGWGMWPIWACSILLVAFAFERRKALQAHRIIDETMIERVTELVDDMKLAEAEEEARKSGTVVGKAWAHGFHEFSLGGVPLIESLMNSTLLALKPLKRNFQVISTIAVLAPLLGLQGTVLGMIITFSQIAAVGGADKAKLADGIALALFTTAGGLFVAIPAIICGRYFSARVSAFAEHAEAAIYRINYRYQHALVHRKEKG